MSKTSSDAALSQRSDMVVYLNGEFIPANQARVGIATHALSYGTGCFEGIRAYYNSEKDQLYIFRALEHFQRLARSCKIMNIQLRHTPEELVELLSELIRRNGFRENCYMRPFAYKADEIIGVKLNGLQDDFTMFALPMGDYIATTGLRCMVSSWRRVDDNMIPARAKISGAYVNSAFAKSEALMGGYDEAIMLTNEGHVSEGSAENIFMVVGGELITPPPSENILQGITRDSIMALARRELEVLTRERVIDRTELYTADELFLTGTGAQIAPIIEVDHRAIGSGAVGPLSAKLTKLYHDVTHGLREEYMDWLTPVYTSTRVSSNGHHSANGHNGHNGAKAKSGKQTASAKK
ncbi:MAG TPA: branched-chain amino acid transaminase [Ktedonobacterales bacterium]